MIKTADGTEVYENEYEGKIYCAVEDYVDDLIRDCGEAIAHGMLTERPSSAFKGMLKYIYINIFKVKDTDKVRYKNQNCNIDYSDIELIDEIWDIYTMLCYRYRQYPNVLNFSVMTGIRAETISRWRHGVLREGGDDKATSLHSQTVKKWAEESEAASHDGAMAGNVGCIFDLKANYGWSDQPTIEQRIGEQIVKETAKQISDKYKSYAIAKDNNKQIELNEID